MSINTERLILRGRLEELIQKKTALALDAEARIRAIKNLLAVSSISPLAEIDLAAVASLSAEADVLKNEYTKICEKIADIQAEL